MTEGAPSDGIAFDTNLLSKPTQRRLVTLWMELADSTTTILPGVWDELVEPNAKPRSQRDLAVNHTHRAAWLMALDEPSSPFTLVELTPEQAEFSADILHSFTLRCFPKLSDVDDIPRNSDSIILSEALAMNLDCIVTNNMETVDHVEVNALLTKTMGRNSPFVRTADEAFLNAHPGGRAADELLVMAMASCWPDDGRELDLGDAHDLLCPLTERLAKGARMPNVAQRLHNTFKTCQDLEVLLERSRFLAKESNALLCERKRADFVRNSALSHGRSNFGR